MSLTNLSLSILCIRLVYGRTFHIGEEFESFAEDFGCAKTGSGYLFDCAWFDAAFSGVMFGIVLIVSQLLSERTKLYKKLDNNERYEWVASLSNFILSIVSTVGALYILSINEWYLDHPGDSKNNVDAYDPALNFFGIHLFIYLFILFLI